MQSRYILEIEIPSLQQMFCKRVKQQILTSLSNMHFIEFNVIKKAAQIKSYKIYSVSSYFVK